MVLVDAGRNQHVWHFLVLMLFMKMKKINIFDLATKISWPIDWCILCKNMTLELNLIRDQHLLLYEFARIWVSVLHDRVYHVCMFKICMPPLNHLPSPVKVC
ncbi:hypothetical protein ILYODFUR_020529 [Ilyodon furcidens]|uniref:Uncharacterized protein n=1 Tax=Ilyodon furcidens TaxID=33524 RepID=A0ABV0SMW8_9TELE